jgi:hypothetical protein
VTSLRPLRRLIWIGTEMVNRPSLARVDAAAPDRCQGRDALQSHAVRLQVECLHRSCAAILLLRSMVHVNISSKCYRHGTCGSRRAKAKGFLKSNTGDGS